MTWLARLKKSAVAPDTHPAKPTKPPFAGFAGTPPALFQNSGGNAPAANDPAHAQPFDREAFEERAAIIEHDGGLPRHQAEAMAAVICCEPLDPDRHCWPRTQAMNTTEIDTFNGRLHLFTRHGLDYTEAEALADSLVTRDRDGDDRRLCLECRHLQHGIGLWGCSQLRRAGLAVSGVPAELLKMLQRCKGFNDTVSESVGKEASK